MSNQRTSILHFQFQTYIVYLQVIHIASIHGKRQHVLSTKACSTPTPGVLLRPQVWQASGSTSAKPGVSRLLAQVLASIARTGCLHPFVFPVWLGPLSNFWLLANMFCLAELSPSPLAEPCPSSCERLNLGQRQTLPTNPITNQQAV